MNIAQMGALALGSVIFSMYACDAQAQEPRPTAGDAVGAMVADGSRQVAAGAGLAGYTTSDTLDGLGWSGCTVAAWVVGEDRDQAPSFGNALVGIGRLAIGAPAGALCVLGHGLAVPAKVFGYSFTAFGNLGGK